jgi:hypothetical protein
VAALSVRRVGVPLGLPGCVLAGAAVAPGGAGPAAAAAGHQAGWRIVPSPNGSRVGDNTLVQVSAGSATSAWAVGYAGGAGTFRTLIQRWDGARWAVVPSPSPSPFDNVLAGVATLSRASAWTVGYDLVNGYHRALIEHWDGTAWQVMPTPRAGPRDSDLWGVTALSATNAWAVGNENIGAFRFRPLIEHWNGAAWTLVRVPSPPLTGTGATLSGVAATSPRDIWAVGNYDTGTRFQPLIEHFNGTHWSLIPAPTPGSALLSRISLQAPGNGWAAGARGAAGRTQALLMHWDGRHWAAARSPAISRSGLADVLALTPRLAWAVGSYSPSTGVNRTLIERWTGRAWTVTPSPNRRQGSELLGITGTQRHLWAVGAALTDTCPPEVSWAVIVARSPSESSAAASSSRCRPRHRPGRSPTPATCPAWTPGISSARPLLALTHGSRSAGATPGCDSSRER